MIDFATPEIKFAAAAVQQAATLVRRIQEEMVTAALTKQDRSPVTIADFASQALVGYLLSKKFPEDILVAEEDSAALRIDGNTDNLLRVTRFVQAEIPEATPEAVCKWIDHGSGEAAARFWTLDPIDGTKGFLRGDQYAVALALVVDDQVQIGVLGCPQLSQAHRLDVGGPGSLVIAARGQGAWTAPLNEPIAYERLRVSTITNPAEARILRSFESGHTNVSQIDQFSEALGAEVDPVRLDSQAKYAVLAAGKGDLLVRLLSPKKPDYREKIWDQAAGSLVVEEAGGKITDLHGKPLDFTAGRTLAMAAFVCSSSCFRAWGGGSAKENPGNVPITNSIKSARARAMAYLSGFFSRAVPESFRLHHFTSPGRNFSISCCHLPLPLLRVWSAFRSPC